MEISARDIALLEAVKSGTLLQLKTCAEDYVCDINCQEGGSKKTPLHYAVEKSKADAVEYLLKRGAKASLVDKNDETAFQASLRIADASVLSKLLAKGAMKLSSADIESALFFCAKYNHCNGLKMWLETVKSNKGLSSGKSSTEWNAPNVNCKGEHGRSPLHMAAASGHRTICEILLNYGADINSKDSENQNALFSAIRFKRISVMQLLLAKGIAIEHRNSHGFTALHNACAHGDESELKTITPFFEDIPRPADVMAIKDHEGHTALFSAAKRYQVETLKYLVQKRKADVNATDAEGQNLLHYIASYYEETSQKRKAQVQAVTTLLRLSCQWKAVDMALRTPLMYACMCGNSDVLRVLIHEADSACEEDEDEMIAFLSLADTDGNTPLHLSLLQQKNCSEILRMLLAYKISVPDLRNKEGKTALDLCAKDAELKNTLVSHQQRLGSSHLKPPPQAKNDLLLPSSSASASNAKPPAASVIKSVTSASSASSNNKPAAVVAISAASTVVLPSNSKSPAAISSSAQPKPQNKVTAPALPPSSIPKPTPLNSSDRTPPTTPPESTPPIENDSDNDDKKAETKKKRSNNNDLEHRDDDELSETDKSGSSDQDENEQKNKKKQKPIDSDSFKNNKNANDDFPAFKRAKIVISSDRSNDNNDNGGKTELSDGYVKAATYVPPAPAVNPQSPYVNMRGPALPPPAAAVPAVVKQPALASSSASSLAQSASDVNIANLGVLIEHSELVLGDTIGEGAFGAVRKAEWLAGGLSVVAVKILHKADPKAIQMFYKEVELMSKVRHPNIVQYYGACITPPLCMVMRYLPDSLMQLISRQLPSLAQLISIASGIAKGLCYLHRLKIIHRDLKPSNILLDEHQTAYIADFGVSREYLATAAMTGIGTPLYMAPEVICSKKYGEKVDQYAFAMILWQMLTGKSVAKGFALRDTDEELSAIQIAFKAAMEGVRPQIPLSCPRAVAQLIISCWDAIPEKRPAFDAIIGLLANMHKDLSAGNLK